MIPASVNRSITRLGWSVQHVFGEAPQLSFKSIWNKEKVLYLPCRDPFTHFVSEFFSKALSFIWKCTEDWRVEASPHFVISVFPDVWRKPSIRLLYMQFLLLKCCNPFQHEHLKKVYDSPLSLQFSPWEDHGVFFLSCTGRRRFLAVQTTSLVSEIHFECKLKGFFSSIQKHHPSTLTIHFQKWCCRLHP